MEKGTEEIRCANSRKLAILYPNEQLKMFVN
jgi:hypothetical protein